MSSFTIAAVQSNSIKGAISQNVHRHAELATAARERGADVVVFPELSLTGYEPRHAARLALDADDARLGETDEGLVLLDTRTGAARGAIFRSPL